VKSRLAPVVSAVVASWAGAGLAAGLVAILALGSGACNTEPAGGSQDGATVFQSLCATCHGPDGKPPAAMIARLGVRDLTAAEFRARATPAVVEQQVRHGSQNKLMPAFEGAISEAQIRAVAAYVGSTAFGRPAAPK
jgi:mono/diheme cytochrome c family protein